MNDVLGGLQWVSLASVGVAFGAGGVLGLLHLGGLWLTLQALPSTRAPGLLLGGSLIARTLAVAVAIGLVSRGEAVPLAAAVVGLVVARSAVSVRMAVGELSRGEKRGTPCS